MTRIVARFLAAAAGIAVGAGVGLLGCGLVLGVGGLTVSAPPDGGTQASRDGGPPRADDSGSDASHASDASDDSDASPNQVQYQLELYSHLDVDPTWLSAPISGMDAANAAPAMVRFSNDSGQDGTLIAAPNVDGALYVYSGFDEVASGTHGWTSQEVSPAAVGDGGRLVYTAPAIVRFSNSSGQQGTMIAASRSDGSLYVFSNMDGASSWIPQQIAAPSSQSTPSPPAMVRSANGSAQGTLVAATRADGSLYLYSNSDGTSAWTPQQISAAAAVSTVAMVRFDDSIGIGTELVFTEDDGSLYYDWAVDGSSTWTSQEIAASGIRAATSLLRFLNNTNQTGTGLVASAYDGSLAYYYLFDSASSWNYAQITTPGTGSYSIPAMLRFNYSTSIVATASDGSLNLFSNSDGVPGFGMEVIGAPQSVEPLSAPAIVRTANGTQVAVAGPPRVVAGAQK